MVNHPSNFILRSSMMNAQFAGPGRAPARRHLRMRSFVDRLLRLPNPFWIIIMFARSASFAQTSFYSVVDTDLTPYANGALIRSEPIEGAPDGATDYRVLYKSEGLHGEAIAVSGVVIVPVGPAPGGAVQSSRGRIPPRASFPNALRLWRVCCSSRSRACMKCSIAAMSSRRLTIPVSALPVRTHTWWESAKAARFSILCG
jgi:hypothetical protein